MNPHRWIATVGIVAVVAGLGASLGAATPGRASTAFPKHYKLTNETLISIKHTPPAGNNLVRLRRDLVGPTGTKAAWTVSFREHRTSGTVVCGGKNLTGRWTSILGRAGSGTLRVTGYGELLLTITHAAGVFTDTDGPPKCEEWTGTYRGVTGSVKGKHGTFHWLRTPGTLTLV